MLSILIPVFNFDIQNLVAELHEQCVRASIDFEIYCLDDGSHAGFRRRNAGISALSGVIYAEMPQNVGRSKIRNELARRARFDYLIFMDCDARVVSADYIQNYLSALPDPRQTPKFVLCGGRTYSPVPPEDPALRLHWKYGSRREQTTAAQRRQHPHHAFMTNNFLIAKQVFADIQFDESLTRYGHEDTAFGLELRRLGIPVFHLDNPLEHIGLEPAPVFLEKSLKALDNLHLLARRDEWIDTRLLHWYRRFRAWHLAPFAGWLFGRLRPAIARQLCSSAPSLVLFDFFKLGYLCGK
ncbi:MAG: glycosyltransferase [Bacteroidetes bacterium]|nr:MAG: glycosyltransferase [Bacteroidota bacterium]